MKLLITLLDLKRVFIREPHISLDWNLHSLLTYTPRFAHATLQFIGSRGVNSLEWWMLFISVINSTILVSMVTFAHNMVSPSALFKTSEDVYNMDETSFFYCAKPN